jgi:hypothetical protein
MADIRTLKVGLLADISDFSKGLDKADNETKTFGNKLGDFSKKAGLALAAVGAAAFAAAVDFTKAAIEDEKSAQNLSTTLKSLAGATDEVVASTEDFILQTSLASGVADDQLRPGLERLLRATGDVTKSQELLNLALDLSVATGKPLEAVTNALGKSYEGSNGALAKLGVGLDAASLKGMSFDEVVTNLNGKFGEFSENQADTFAGKLARLSVGFNEAKETVGGFILDGLQPLIDLTVNELIPKLASISQEIGEKLQPTFAVLTDYIQTVVVPAFTAIWAFIQDYLVPIIKTILTPILEGLGTVFGKITELVKENQGAITVLGNLFKFLAGIARDVLAPVFGGVLKAAFAGISIVIDAVSAGIRGLTSIINGAISAVNVLISAYNTVNNLVGGKDLPKIPNIPTRATGGPVNAGTTYLVGEKGPELFTPRNSGAIVPNNKLGGGQTVNYNITVNGAIDPSNVARQIANLLNNEATRSGAFTNLGQGRNTLGIATA